MRASRGVAVLPVAIILLIVILVTAGILFFMFRNPGPMRSDTPYHAVLLDNGSVFFGQVEGFGTPFVVLRDVYYVQSRVNPENKQTQNVLIKRGKEWHSPDRMVINANKIVFFEPVATDSTVAKLIADSRR